MIGLLVCTVVFTFFIYIWIKQYLSPLRAIPEPFSWPFINHTLYFLSTKDQIGVLQNWCNQFKEEGIFKFSVIYSRLGYIVSLLKPEYVKSVLSRPDIFVRPEGFQRIFPLVEDGLLASTGEHHRFQKKLLSKAFALAQMKYYIPTFCKHTKILIKLWQAYLQDDANGKNIEVRTYFTNMSFDIIADTSFGYNINSQKTGRNLFADTFKGAVETALMSLKTRFLMRIVPFLGKLPFGPGRVLKESEVTSLKILDEVLAARKEKIAKDSLTELERNDILSIMMNEKDETNKGFSDKLIKNNIFTFFVAGHETTATALPVILLFLSKYPDLQEKARSEVIEKLGGRHELTYDDMNNLPYTTAFIKECLRMKPPIPLGGRVSLCEYSFGKYTIPKGTFVQFPHFYLNSETESTDYADEFIPERHLEGSIKTGTSFTFGYGPYACIGKNFAMQEIKVATVLLLQHFKFTVDPGKDSFKWRSGIALKSVPEILIRVFPLETK